MAASLQEISTGKRASPAVAPARTRAPDPRRPSRLGITLAACLLFGLLLWRLAVPDATPWIDLAALAAAWAFLLAVRTLLKKSRR